MHPEEASLKKPAGEKAADENIDKKLIKQVLSGDTDAFACIVDRYKSRVFTLSYRMLSSREEAEDISQEAFLKIYSNLKIYDSRRTSFSTWIYRITYNLCIDHLRKRKETAPLEEHILSSDSGTPEEQAIASENKKRLYHAVHELPEIYRTPLVLFHFHNLSYQEICKVLDVPISIVKNRLFRARKLLREKLVGGESGEM